MFLIKLLFVFLLSLLFIKLIIKYAKLLGLVDIPNERSSHTTITPRGAGIGFGFAFFVVSLFGFYEFFIKYWLVYLAMFVVFVVGILDDHKDASPKAKFYAIFVATFLLFLSDISIDSLGYYFGFEISLWYFALPFTMFAIAGFTNALNLVDGLDGLASSVSMVILSSFLYIGYIYEDMFIVTICSLVIVSLLAFLIYNWNPANIFMGDSGSLFLGFVIALVAVRCIEYIHPLSVLYLAAVPILDTLIVMTRRIRKGLSPFSPDKTHIHHILLKFFEMEVKKTVVFLILMQLLFSLGGIMLALNSYELGQGVASTMALVTFIGINILFYMIFTGMQRRLKYIDKLKKRKTRKKKDKKTI